MNGVNLRDIIKILLLLFQAKDPVVDGEFKRISEEVASLHLKKNRPIQKPKVHEFGNRIRIETP